MSDSRREFLQRLATSAAALALDPFRGIAVDDDLYQNARLSLAIRRPAGWEFSSVADFAALRDRQVLQAVLAQEPHPLKDPDNLPVFLVEDRSHATADFAPSISLWDEPLRGPAPPDQALAHREVMLAGFASAYRDVHVALEPQPLLLKGAYATFSRWSYWHDLDNGKEYHLSIRSVVVFREPRVHTYHLVDSERKPVINDDVWDAFLTSIDYKS